MINRIVVAAKQGLAQWNIAQINSSMALFQPQVTRDGASFWVKPQPNIVKISVDVAIFEDRGGIGFGLIARDFEGCLLEAKTFFFVSNLVSPVMAEAMAVKEALGWCDRTD